MQDLINEITKLIEYAGENGTIQKNDIDKLCIKKLESVIFDLIRQFRQKRHSNSIRSFKKSALCKRAIAKNNSNIIQSL